MEFKDVVKMRRIELGMTQPDLAYVLKVCPATVSLWERGRTKPTFNSLTALSKVLGVPEQELMHPKSENKENEDNKNVQ